MQLLIEGQMMKYAIGCHKYSMQFIKPAHNNPRSQALTQEQVRIRISLNVEGDERDASYLKLFRYR